MRRSTIICPHQRFATIPNTRTSLSICPSNLVIGSDPTGKKIQSQWLDPRNGPGESLTRKNHFGIPRKGMSTYTSSTVVQSLHQIRVAGQKYMTSLCAAVCITVAYICQYIELRSATARQSGIWLSTQGLLAMARVLAWHWAPKSSGFLHRG